MGLELTGERTVPGVAHENYWFRRHEVAYRFAATHCEGRTVLDAGCGEGYGTAILAEGATAAAGVELVAAVVDHARTAYPHLEFVQADLCALPLGEASVDAVVSLQVIEHLWDIPGYLREVARVLRPDGLFVCGTPNRLTFTPDSDTPVNPFHTVEFSPEELTALLQPRFAQVDLVGVFHGPRLSSTEAERRRTLPDLVLDDPPEQWPAWLAELVHSVTVDDFVIGEDGLDDSLDLLALARRPEAIA